MNIEEIVKQLKFCEFTDKLDHPIEMNVAFIELEKITGKTLIPKFSVGETLFMMKENKVIKIIISCSEIFNVDSNQARISYNAKNFTNSQSWLDHSHISESELFRTKEELLNNL